MLHVCALIIWGFTVPAVVQVWTITAKETIMCAASSHFCVVKKKIQVGASGRKTLRYHRWVRDSN